jgi:hypothetical protein
MAQPGRPPKPVEEKRRLGNPGKRALPTSGALAIVEPIGKTMADWSALDAFDQVMSDGVNWLARTDAPTLALLREMLEERQVLRAAVLAGAGDRRQLRELDKQIAERLSALGFDPAARSRLGLAEVKRVSKLEELRRVASPVVNENDGG